MHLNVEMELPCWMCSGKSFHTSGALFEKASLPDLEDGRSGRSENHSLWYMSGAHVQWRPVFFFFFFFCKTCRAGEELIEHLRTQQQPEEHSAMADMSDSESGEVRYHLATRYQQNNELPLSTMPGVAPFDTHSGYGGFGRIHRSAWIIHVGLVSKYLFFFFFFFLPVYMLHPIAGRYPIAVTLPIAVTFSMIHMKMIVSELFSL